MLTAVYALILIACSSILGLFGFFVGRCARKLPVIDNHLPWALHRGQIPHSDPIPRLSRRHGRADADRCRSGLG